MPLTSHQITISALELLDESGLDALSTRRLAERLGVKGPALYRHFRNKADLIDSMGAHLLSTCFAALDEDCPPQDWLRGLAMQSRSAMLSHTDGARLLALSSPSGKRRSKLATDVTQPLVRQGVAFRSARLAIITMSAFAEGWTINEEQAVTRALMEKELGNLDAAFAEALDGIIRGLAPGLETAT